MTGFHIIIPARYASTRLPGKPLLDLGGKMMIQRVVECARRSAAQSITVATDDTRIERAVRAFGADAVMTSKHHACGADRIAEAADKMQLAEDAIIVNVQGDEPEMPAALIDQVAAALADADGAANAAIATAMAPLTAAQWRDPSVVKVVVARNGDALYFSRAPIPWAHDDTDDAGATARRHLGIYAYRCGYLRRFAARGVCELEARERLEQLRALWHGERIACVDAVEVPPPGIDTAADLARARAAFDG